MGSDASGRSSRLDVGDMEVDPDRSVDSPAPPDRISAFVRNEDIGKLDRHEHYVERYQLWSVPPHLLNTLLTHAAGTMRTGTGRRTTPNAQLSRSRTFRTATLL
jgi:hypothetical protein